MVTTIGTSSDMAKLVENFILLEHDAIAAYETTIVARSKRDWVWIMARRPQIDEATYQGLVQRVEALGYNISQLRKVPQQPLNRRQDVDFELATD